MSASDPESRTQILDCNDLIGVSPELVVILSLSSRFCFPSNQDVAISMLNASEHNQAKHHDCVDCWPSSRAENGQQSLKDDHTMGRYSLWLLTISQMWRARIVAGINIELFKIFIHCRYNVSSFLIIAAYASSPILLTKHKSQPLGSWSGAHRKNIWITLIKNVFISNFKFNNDSNILILRVK